MAEKLEQVLKAFKEGQLSIEDAVAKLKGYEELGYAKIDHQRKERKGFPEVIYAEGKTSQQVLHIFLRLKEKNTRVLATRASEETAELVSKFIPEAAYHPLARTLFWKADIQSSYLYPGYIAIVCAGTSDLPVAEEAAVTCEAMGCRVEKIYDVGVAGIHRLFDQLERIEQADVVIVVAGMEGALASVVGGLISKPMIAVPTSIGYGANFGGLSALLTMLNSCATGVTVVNIDNGFGAGYSASVILKNKYEGRI